MICFRTTHHEQWFHYKQIFVNLLWNLFLQLFSICAIIFTSGEYRAAQRITVVKSIARHSPVVKLERPYSPVHMNSACILYFCLCLPCISHINFEFVFLLLTSVNSTRVVEFSDFNSIDRQCQQYGVPDNSARGLYCIEPGP